jgi:aspartyl-tRNA(Asn)/glutamyl-tRNA(Gln) amidotransferase subunit B
MTATTSGKLINGSTGDWEVVIGLEVHAQVTSDAKLFSGASTEFGGAPNSHVSLVDAAMPGMLPVINEQCVKQAIRTGLGLNAKINLRSVFDRKNYFYADSPQGYQISQYRSPIVGEGEVTVELEGGKTATIGIERLHLEQDAGKLLHDRSPTMSFVDLNRCGVALMEIVSKPDIRDAEQAKAYVTKVRSILRYLGTCDGDMEKGSLRADVNVSVRKPGGPLGTRCEIKNMNSIAFIGEAIESEAKRQIRVLEDGGTIEQETRLFEPDTLQTRAMRSKEEAHDYRYFPDPDLLPLEFDQAFVDALRADLPELPDQKKVRYVADFGLSEYDASVLVADPERSQYFEKMVDDGAEPKAAANWLINEYLGQLSKYEEAQAELAKAEADLAKAEVDLSEAEVELVEAEADLAAVEPPSINVSISPGSSARSGQITINWTTPEANSAIVRMITSHDITGKSAKALLGFVIEIGPKADPEDVKTIADRLNLKQVTDLSAIEKVVDDIIASNPDKVAQAKAKPALMGWFVGQVMKSSGGKANPQAVNDLLKSKLGI